MARNFRGLAFVTGFAPVSNLSLHSFPDEILADGFGGGVGALVCQAVYEVENYSMEGRGNE